MKRIVLSVLALALALAVPALAAGAKSHKINATIHAAQVGVQGSAGIVAGEFSDASLGKGAVLYKGTGTPSAAKLAFTTFNTKGTIKGTANSTITPAQGGGFTITGSGKFTGGTGLYRGAKGSFTLNGFEDSSGHIASKVKGTIKY
jgi:cyanate permease